MEIEASKAVQDRVAQTAERLLRDAGISTGMRVLDVGCGRGDVSLMAARLVGESGLVIGLDRDERATSAATERAHGLGIKNVKFIPGDLHAPPIVDAPYDAVIGRRVLMYQPDRVAALRPLVDALQPGGLVAFQEVDATMVPASTKPHPLHERVTRWIWQTVEREGATTAMGFELPVVLEAAGLEVEGLRAEAIIQTKHHRHLTAWIVRAMIPRIVERGVASEAEIDIETLDTRLAEELDRVNSAFIGDMVFSAWARKPLRSVA
ncbi:methyltransferase domain-containing protein [Polyangium sp. 15x6]|uniref:methyltransferase domain-containing protein n=1 Tax=Polyangium sp. 15x6 TaxID=3042687 RepID=UPI00249AB4A2|nr:methyltransferase domain-containing protein [Polyangium sp. 15x6]MDI3285220.1 methyltransferase domain-containing protein [Polyangium sp. 15x6]